MAISIYEEWGFADNWISDYLDGDSDQLDPCLATFRRIDQIWDDGNKFNKIKVNLELADKASLRIDILRIIKRNFNNIRELYKDKDLNFKIKKLHLDYDFENNKSTEDIEFINQISPKILTIRGDKWTVVNIKSLSLLNYENVDLNVCFMIKANIYFWFINTPIQHFDSKSGQIFTFQWESIKIFIEKYEDEESVSYEDEKNGIEKVKLLKTNSGNFLFIPLDIIGNLSYSRFREILNVDDINKQFSDLRVQHQFKENGLIIPMGYSNRIFIYLKDKNLNYLNQYKDINKIFNEKQIELIINNFGRLLEIKQLLPDDFSRINFRYINTYDSTDIGEYSVSEIMDDPDWINLKFNYCDNYSRKFVKAASAPESSPICQLKQSEC